MLKCFFSVEGGLWYRMENQGSINELQAFESNSKNNWFGTSHLSVSWSSGTVTQPPGVVHSGKYSAVAEQSTIGCSSSLAAAAAAQAGQPTPAPSSVPTLHPAGCLACPLQKPALLCSTFKVWPFYWVLIWVSWRTEKLWELRNIGERPIPLQTPFKTQSWWTNYFAQIRLTV